MGTPENPKSKDVKVGRRAFVGGAAGLGVAALLSPERLFAKAEALRTQQDLFVINMVGGIRNPNPREGGRGAGPPGLGDRAINDAIASGMAAVNTTIGYVAGPDDPFESSVQSVARWNQIIQGEPDRLLKVWDSRDIEHAHETDRVGVIMGFQNAAMMGEDADRVRTFAGLGVRIIQLTYNGPNQLGHGSMVPENGGLTDFGRDVVAALNETRTLMDLSHSGEQTCLDAIGAANAPLTISHTGCRSVTDLPRNKTDRELRGVAEGGGLVGIYFMPFLAEDGMAMAEDVVEHVEHAIDVCGEDHVGIGTDGGTTLIDDMDAFREAVARDVERRRAAGISARGERPGVVPMIPDLQGPEQFAKLARLLSERGHSHNRIEKILGRNALRVLKEAWGQ